MSETAILVFEDNLFVQEGIQKTLDQRGYSVFEIVDALTNAAPAIERAIAAGVLAAIVDGKLIGGNDDDGRRIVAMLKSTPIKSISYSTSGARTMGADVTVGKGTSVAELMNGVAQAIRLAKSHK